MSRVAPLADPGPPVELLRRDLGDHIAVEDSDDEGRRIAHGGDAHISRSWRGGGTPLEDECPCPQEPCGYVALSKIVEGCPQHDLAAAKTIRDSHLPDTCPGGGSDEFTVDRGD